MKGELTCIKDDSNEMITVEIVDSTLQAKDQIKEYVDRGDQLVGTNFLDFFLNTYEKEEATLTESKQGRKPNERVPYKDGTGHGKKCRVFWTRDHETMPNFAGDWFPRNDVPELSEFYHACMLALLMPWTEIKNLKSKAQTFKESFESFVNMADEGIMDTLDNIQYQHECHDSATKKKGTEHVTSPGTTALPDESETRIVDISTGDAKFTQRDVEVQLASEFSQDDRLFAEVALNIAIDHNIFSDEPIPTCWKDVAMPATSDQMEEYYRLDKLVQAITKGRIVPDNRNDIQPESFAVSEQRQEAGGVEKMTKAEIELPHLAALNADQRRAHDIIASHLKAHLDSRAPRQTLMAVMGQGGTGKSTMLNAITTTFDLLDSSQLLAKTAMSGIAASLIGGTTLHWFASLPARKIPQSDIWPDSPGKLMHDRRKTNLVPPQWLAIDEIRMCMLDLLTLLSQVMGKARVRLGTADSTVPFGGLNILIMGDFHQFPPVGHPNNALYCSLNTRNTLVVGKAIYQQFDTVIDLSQQMRVTDSEWNSILQRSREGDYSETDLDEIHKLGLTNPKCDVLDFSSERWSNAILVTPCNSVKNAWNCASLRKHCACTGNLLYICDAKDTVGHKRSSTNMEQKVNIAGLKTDATKKLAHRIELAVRMKVMATLNLATEADLTNSSRGIIEDIVLDPRERVQHTEISSEGEVWLQYPPAMVVFHPFHCEFKPFPGFEAGLVPIFPSEVNFTINYGNDPKTKIHRRQFPLCAGYAFTNYKSQGQTLEYVIVDIGTTRRFPVTPFTLYVALSHSGGRHRIRLLRDFKDDIFTQHPSEQLRVEDERLRGLAGETARKFDAGFYNFV